MEVVFLQTFENDVKRIQDKSLLRKLKDVILTLENSNNLREIVGIRKITGSNTAFRLRIRDYRLGLYYENGIIELCRFVHRKDIYKLFP